MLKIITSYSNVSIEKTQKIIILTGCGKLDVGRKDELH